jgi:cysteinyl-tRNA synthetase
MLKVYNTLTRKKEVFKSKNPKKVGIYSCGPTVYWNQHIGNMYAYLQWDILVRFLKYSKYQTKWVMNLTDVGHLTSDEDTGEDKLEKGAKREGLSVWQIAEKYTKQFLQNLDLLNIQRPDVLCRATDCIQEQIKIIKKIEKNGFTYKTKTGLVFDTAKFPGYAKFAKLKLKKQKSGSRVQIDQEKKQPWDFLLWVTNQPNHVMQWDSPWGKGFPGWHVECTAMSTKYLGNNFDIHTGGKEHIPVHHTNEIAQAFGAFGKMAANYWLHNEWLLIDKKKVSKSLGNTVLVTDLMDKGFDPLAFRYLVLTSHYRQGLNFTWQALEASQNALDNLYEKVRELKISKTKTINSKTKIKDYQKKFIDSLGNDLNAPKALALMWQVIKSSQLSDKDKYNLVLDFDQVFGLKLKDVKKESIPQETIKLAQLRERYRQEKNWLEADETRKKIESMGYKVEDTETGFNIKKY